MSSTLITWVWRRCERRAKEDHWRLVKPGVTVCVSPVHAVAELCRIGTAFKLVITFGDQDLSYSTALESTRQRLNCEPRWQQESSKGQKGCWSAKVEGWSLSRGGARILVEIQDLGSRDKRRKRNSSLVLTPLLCLSPDNVFECTDWQTLFKNVKSGWKVCFPQ